MSIKKILIFAHATMFLVVLLLFILLFVGITADEDEDEEPEYETGLQLLEQVLAYRSLVAQYAEEYDISDYIDVLLAIMEVETHGEGNDPMQAMTNSNIPEDEQTPERSVQGGCLYFSVLLARAEARGCDLDTVIQAYNFGGGYIDYVAVRGKEHTFALASAYAEMQSDGETVPYDNEIAVLCNGGWRYDFGNMFYVYLVKQYLPSDEISSDIFELVMTEALKYEGWAYCWGGNTPSTSFDCSGLTQWCYGQAGISLPRTAQQQYNVTQHIALAGAEPGDLVFFTDTYSTSNYITHVGIYVGNYKMYDAGDPIGYSDLNTVYWQNHLVCAGRIITSE